MASGLKITGVDRMPLEVPFRAASEPWLSVDVDRLRYVDVFRLRTNDPDIVGYGESLTGQRSVDLPEQMAKLIGHSPVTSALDDSLGTGVQMAILDVLGKHLGVPAWQILAPEPFRDRCAISWWSSQLTPLDALESEVRSAWSEGYLAHKLKARPWCNVFDQLDAIGTVAPRDYKVDLDWNGMLQTRGEAASVLRALDEVERVGIYESPVRRHDVEGMAVLRRQVARPLAEHYRPDTYRSLLRADAVDGFVLFEGGAAGLMRQDHVVQAFEKTHWLQILGSGLATAFTAHLAAVMSGARWPLITCLNIYADDLLAAPLQVSGGAVTVPDGPGLGVVVDEDALERYRVDQDRERTDTRRLLVVSAAGSERVYGSAGELRRDAVERGWTFVQPADIRLEIWDDDGGAEFERAYQHAKGPGRYE